MNLSTNNKVIQLFKSFYESFAHNHKGNIFILFLGAVISGFLEIMGLLLLYLMLKILINVELLKNYPLINDFLIDSGFTTKKEIIIIFGLSILVIFILKNIYILFYYHMQNLTIMKWKAELSTLFMKKYLMCPYQIVQSYDSATLIRNVDVIISRALNGFVLSGFNFCANLITGIIIFLILIHKHFETTVIIGATMIIASYIQNKLIRKKQLKLGEERNKLSTELNKHMFQSFYSIRETKMTHKEHFFINNFKQINKVSLSNEAVSSLLVRVPTHITEVIIISCIVFFSGAVLLNNLDNAESSVSTLGLLVGIAFRIAPIMNRAVSSMQSMNKETSSMKTFIKEFRFLRKNAIFKDESYETLPFMEKIVFKNISFHYKHSEEEMVLKNIDLTIKKGEFIGLVGPSGAGKTTIVDIITGLLSPTEGVLEIDTTKIENNKDIFCWQKNIAYVPQATYISDSSIANNIAFGEKPENIDRDKVIDCLKKVELYDFIISKQDGIDFVAGENGKHLSGGQKQRVGIARALYLNRDVLILDESTSALDVDTENKIMDIILSLKSEKTIIAIAHRLSTIYESDRVIYLEEGEVQGIAPFKELTNTNKNFKKLSNLSRIETMTPDLN